MVTQIQILNRNSIESNAEFAIRVNEEARKLQAHDIEVFAETETTYITAIIKYEVIET